MKSLLTAFTAVALLTTVSAADAQPLRQLTRKPSAAKPAAEPNAPPPPGPNDWRTVDPENMLVIDTSKGRVILELAPQVAPNHVERIKTLARRKFYDGLEFFRVIDGFMDQTGDPENKGTGQSDLPDLKGEFFFKRDPADPNFVSVGTVIQNEAGFYGSMPVFSQLALMAPLMADGKVNAWGAFCAGMIGAARSGDPDSANSQFFLMRDNYPALEKTYTPYGRLLSGLNVIRAIKVGEPVEPPRDTMISVRVAADMPEAERPKARIVDTKSAWFKARANEIFIDRGIVFTPCAVDLPVEVR
jgi:peptidylprolyl isomerase